jgi:hypothetical protein
MRMTRARSVALLRFDDISDAPDRVDHRRPIRVDLLA